MAFTKVIVLHFDKDQLADLTIIHGIAGIVSQVLAQFADMTSRYTQEMQTIDGLLRRRNEIQASYTTIPQINGSRSKKGAILRDVTKKWYNIYVKLDKRKP
ncbi:hypothetical protein L1987_48432 [Smallanthus sonchifolius]|uniref:Uncharacterized protein n=1 Tax=Smallanthus sonchifolius TaxID=185202 RepID=A0ACB9FSK6_9ASTR|nr:hypothetical protein L1987_48432 [Smallanthus sonchifolius]